MPDELKIYVKTNETVVQDFVYGRNDELKLPFRSELSSTSFATIFYLCAYKCYLEADYVLTTPYLMYDLALRPDNYDSWMGLAMTISYDLEKRWSVSVEIR